MRQAGARIVRSILMKALPFSRASCCRYEPSGKIVLVACVHEYFILSSVSTFIFTFTFNFNFTLRSRPRIRSCFCKSQTLAILWLFSSRFLFNLFAENYSLAVTTIPLSDILYTARQISRNFTLTILQNAFSYSSFRGLSSCSSWCGGAV